VDDIDQLLTKQLRQLTEAPRSRRVCEEGLTGCYSGVDYGGQPGNRVQPRDRPGMVVSHLSSPYEPDPERR
jgi:hypothetical protein